ncbi:MAG: hypothetical protein VKJ04_11215 [Vampirovibrionales bacterium]|nr:hypothetical protein [Vampirovibrionales bacterium]
MIIAQSLAECGVWSIHERSAAGKSDKEMSFSPERLVLLHNKQSLEQAFYATV